MAVSLIVSELLLLAHPDCTAELGDLQRCAERAAWRVHVFTKKLGMHRHQNDWGMTSVVLDHLRQHQSLRFARRQLDIGNDHVNGVIKNVAITGRPSPDEMGIARPPEASEKRMGGRSAVASRSRCVSRAPGSATLP